MDEALALPTEESVRLALRTQQVIAYESGAADTVDPLAGSYYIESLTREIEKAVWVYLDKIDRMGGMLAAIEAGYVQKQIQESAYAFQREVDSGERVIVGVNRFQDEVAAVPLRTLKVSRESEDRQIARLARVKRERDSRRVLETLAAVKAAAVDGKNLMPPILEAVKALATVQEISDQLRAVFGEHKEVVTI